MQEQEQRSKQEHRSEQTEETTQPQAETDKAKKKQELDDDVDALLEEIDSVLEEDAQTFVSQYCQKGGELKTK